MGLYWMTEKEKKAAYKRDNYSCAYCKRSIFDSDIVLTLDYKDCRRYGLLFITACRDCVGSARIDRNRAIYTLTRSIKGIGVKSATELIDTYGSIRWLYSVVQGNPDEFTALFRNRLLGSRDKTTRFWIKSGE